MLAPPRSRILAWLKPLLSLSVVLAVGYFFSQSLSANWHKLADISLRPNLLTILSIVCFLLAVLASGSLWGRLLTSLTGRRVPSSEAVRVHCLSWILKYIPGQAGSLVNKLSWGVRRGFSKKSITSSFLYENMFLVLSGTLLAVPAVLLRVHQLSTRISLFLPLLLVLPALVLVYPPLFYNFLNGFLTKLGRKPLLAADFLATKRFIIYLAMYGLPRLLNGLAFVLITASLLPIRPSMYIGLAGGYILAGVVGILALFVPSGLGVRESVIVLFASQYMSTEQAVVLALLARFYATLSDLGVLAIYLMLGLRPKETRWQK